MKNSKHTSAKVAELASKMLRDNHASQTAKKLAASALSQRNTGNQTGAQMEDLASRVLSSEKYGDTTHQLAASVLAQANKDR